MRSIAERRKERDDIRKEMEATMPMKGVPQAAIDLVWSLAWENGHSGGANEIAICYDDYRAIALLASGEREE